MRTLLVFCLINNNKLSFLYIGHGNVRFGRFQIQFRELNYV